MDDLWAHLPEQQVIDQWLRERGLWDAGLSQHELRRRFVRFYRVDFGVAPESERLRMF